ncbi:uncharacterized protein BO97DRAFT_265412 [Aspergillus homomorphus CBS 101889]|uniref:Uncharacterized protein n=1 Tax=Aspergillus homomorphus (strain CBS 101889) TaxID=1450537 RepID=A0A395HLU6_ASPHC|nr:hypothetical protein BO97DRAFT_265412 [Aspergillus homomorphus CBS 101889]RAL07244.1 hypothetical protein BO97DRAFT_265412 [Aspergillus homomorphus CBS 101889]
MICMIVFGRIVSIVYDLSFGSDIWRNQRDNVAVGCSVNFRCSRSIWLLALSESWVRRRYWLRGYCSFLLLFFFFGCDISPCLVNVM